MSEDEFTNLQRAIEYQGYTWQAAPTVLTALPTEEQDRRLGLRLL